MPRRFALLLAGALLVAALVAAAGRSADQAARQEHAYALTADAIAPLRQSRLAQADVTFRGGPITTSTGETVDVQVSTALPADTSTPESWAEFLTGLTHGPEISLLTVYIVTFDEAQQICGSTHSGATAATSWSRPANWRWRTRLPRRSCDTSTGTTSRFTG